MFVGSSVELWKLQQHTSILTFFADFDVTKRGPDVAVARINTNKINKATYLPTRLAPQVKHTLKIRISECVRSDFV